MKKKSSYKIIFFCVLFYIFTAQVFSEQITTVAIIDIGEVFSAFPDESSGYSKLNNLKQQFQEEIDVQVQKLDVLKRQKLLAIQDNDFAFAEKLEIQITNMANYIDALSKQRQNELIRRSKARTSQEFLTKLQNAISYVSEERGYTLVLHSTMEGIQWWAPVIDITADVIERIHKSKSVN